MNELKIIYDVVNRLGLNNITLTKKEGHMVVFVRKGQWEEFVAEISDKGLLTLRGHDKKKVENADQVIEHVLRGIRTEIRDKSSSLEKLEQHLNSMEESL